MEINVQATKSEKTCIAASRTTQKFIANLGPGFFSNGCSKHSFHPALFKIKQEIARSQVWTSNILDDFLAIRSFVLLSLSCICFSDN